MPDGLPTLYRRLLSEVEEDDTEKLAEILRWLAVA